MLGKFRGHFGQDPLLSGMKETDGLQKFFPQETLAADRRERRL
jgi:hypothetical protein